MAKYDLLPRFFSVVKGCVDGFSVGEAKMGNVIRYFTLKQIEHGFGGGKEESTAPIIATATGTSTSTATETSSTSIATETSTSTATGTSTSNATAGDKEQYTFEGDASVRVRLAYQILENMASLRCKAVTGNDPNTADDVAHHFMDIVMSNAQPIYKDVEDLSDQNKCMERQNSLRPIFVNYFKVTLYHRVKAVTFRRILAEHEYDLEGLEEIWNTSKKVNCFFFSIQFIYSLNI